jgi:hypothetical protein
MRIRLRKVSDERHQLLISREAASDETVQCETRSYLAHDLLHYAVESEAGLMSGFWGRLAGGATLEHMNDRTTPMDGEMASIERLVGALTSSVKGRSAAQVVDGVRSFTSSQGATMPAWLTETFVIAVQERMRQLLGQWKATPRGSLMELMWPAR